MKPSITNSKDPISAAGNLRMNHVLFLFNSLIEKHLTERGIEFDANKIDLGRAYGSIVSYSDHPDAQNEALKGEINNTIFSIERHPPTYKPESSAANGFFKLGKNRVIILRYANRLIPTPIGEMPDVEEGASTHYTVLNLDKRDDTGDVYIRYANSLGLPVARDPIPLIIQKALEDNAIDLAEDRKDFYSAKQGPFTADCGYCAVYNALTMLQMQPQCEIEEFIAQQRRFLEEKFGREDGAEFINKEDETAAFISSSQRSDMPKTPSTSPSLPSRAWSKIKSLCDYLRKCL
jgi:hypothetical protein